MDDVLLVASADGWLPVKPLGGETTDLWLPASASQCATGGARSFNGTTQYGWVADNATHSTGDVDFWLAAWVWLGAKVTDQSVLSKMNGAANREYRLFHKSATDHFHLYVCEQDGTIIAQVETVSATSLSQWYFVLGYYDAINDTCNISINGGAFVSTATAAAVGDSTAAFVVGETESGGNKFTGRLSRVCMGKPPGAIASVISAIQSTLYNSGNGVNFADLSAAQKTAWGLTAGNGCWYPLNEVNVTDNFVDQVAAVNLTQVASPGVADGPAAMVAIDSSGNAYTGRLIGGDPDQSWNSDNADGSYSATLADTGSGGNDGTMTGFADVDTARKTDVPAALGSGLSLEFKGAQYVSCGADPAALRWGSGNGSACCWFKRAAGIAANERLIGNGRAGANGKRYSLALISTGALYCGIDDNATDVNVTSAATTYADGAWHHAAMVRDGNNLRLYIDGTEDSNSPSDVTAVGSVDDASGYCAIGTIWDATTIAFYQFFNGLIDDARIYNVALTPAQVAELAAGNEATGATPVGHWTFDDAPRTVANVAGGYSYYANGVDSYISIPDPGESTTTLSVGCWVKTTATDNKLIFAHYDSGVGQRSWGVGCANSLVAGVGTELVVILSDDGTFDAGHRKYYYGGNIADGAWHLVGFSYDTGTLLLYIDGTVITPTKTHDDAVATLHNSTAPVSIGSVLNNGVWVSGINALIDDCRIYDRVLTPTEWANWFAGTDPAVTSLLTHHKVDDGPQALTIVNGDPVISLESYEGSRIQFVNATAASRPVWYSAPTGFNSRPALLFDGTSDFLARSNNLFTGSSGLLALIIRPASVTGVQCLFATADIGVADEYWALVLNGTKLEIRQRNTGGTLNQVTGSTTLAINTTYLVMVTSSGTAWTLLVNSTTETLTVASGANNGNWWGDTANRDNVTIGALKTNTTGSYYSGYIADVIYFDATAPTRTSRRKVWKYLRKQYAVY